MSVLVADAEHRHHCNGLCYVPVCTDVCLGVSVFYAMTPALPCVLRSDKTPPLALSLAISHTQNTHENMNTAYTACIQVGKDVTSYLFVKSSQAGL